MKKIILLAIVMALCFSLAGCSDGGSGGGETADNGVVKVYNWGEYIDEEVIEMFEEETGIEVIYDLSKPTRKCTPSSRQAVLPMT